jgi:hypothetical protein
VGRADYQIRGESAPNIPVGASGSISAALGPWPSEPTAAAPLPLSKGTRTPPDSAHPVDSTSPAHKV